MLFDGVLLGGGVTVCVCVCVFQDVLRCGPLTETERQDCGNGVCSHVESSH